MYDAQGRRRKFPDGGEMGILAENLASVDVA
jgi:hypothetical protein